jgi:hypothetical protein
MLVLEVVEGPLQPCYAPDSETSSAHFWSVAHQTASDPQGASLSLRRPETDELLPATTVYILRI